jgi:hypothetical protein
MKRERETRGRPRKKDDTMKFSCFARAGAAMSAYDDARERGEKHSVAVTHAVDSVRRLYPTMRISRTVVKRILAEFRPRNSGTILRFDRSTLREEEAEKHRWIRSQVALMQENKALTSPVLPSDSLPKTVTTFRIRFAERPNYPRHNLKTPKE